MRTIKVWLFLFLAVIASDAGLAEKNAGKDAEKNTLSGRIQERSNKSNKHVVKGGKANKNLNKAKALDNKKFASNKKPVKTTPVKLLKVQKKTNIVRAPSRNVKSSVITTTEKVIFSVLEKATSEGVKVPMIEEPGNGNSQKKIQTIVLKAGSPSSTNSSATPASSTTTKSLTTSTKRVGSVLGVSNSTPEPLTSTKGITIMPSVKTSTTTKPLTSSSSTSEVPPLSKGSKPLIGLDDPQTKVTGNQISDSSSPTIAPSTSTTTTTTKTPKTVKAAASLLLPSMMSRGVIPDPSGLEQDEYSQIYNMDNPTLLRGSGINPIANVSSSSESTSRLRGAGPADQSSSLATTQAPSRETTPQVESPLLRGSKPLLNDPQTLEGAMLVTATTTTTLKTGIANASRSLLPPPYMMLRGVVPVALAKSPSNVTVTKNQTNPASGNNTADQKYGEANSSNSTNVTSTSTLTTTSPTTSTLTTTTTAKTIKASVNLLLPPPNMMLRGVIPVALAIPKLPVNVSTASNQTNTVANVPASNNTDAANFSSLVDNVENASSTAATWPPTATFEKLN